MEVKSLTDFANPADTIALAEKLMRLDDEAFVDAVTHDIGLLKEIDDMRGDLLKAADFFGVEPLELLSSARYDMEYNRPPEHVPVIDEMLMRLVDLDLLRP